MSKLFEFSQEPESIIVDRVLIKVNKVIEKNFPELSTSNEFSNNDATATTQTDPLENIQDIQKESPIRAETSPERKPEAADQLAETRKVLSQNHQEIRSNTKENKASDEPPKPFEEELSLEDTKVNRGKSTFLAITIIVLVVATAIIASKY